MSPAKAGHYVLTTILLMVDQFRVVAINPSAFSTKLFGIPRP